MSVRACVVNDNFVHTVCVHKWFGFHLLPPL